jgi:hypothetical protein
MKWSNVCGFQGPLGRPYVVEQRRLISRQVSGPTSNFVPDTEVGVLLRGSSTPYRPSLHSPKPQTPDLLHLALGLGIATDLEMLILAYFNSHPASDVTRWFGKSTRHAHLQRIVVREVYLLGYDKTLRFVPSLKPSRLCLLYLFILS